MPDTGQPRANQHPGHAAQPGLGDLADHQHPERLKGRFRETRREQEQQLIQRSRQSIVHLHRQPRTGLPPSRGHRSTTAAFEKAADAPSNLSAAQPPQAARHPDITPPRASSQIAAINGKVRNPRLAQRPKTRRGASRRVEMQAKLRERRHAPGPGQRHQQRAARQGACPACSCRYGAAAWCRHDFVLVVGRDSCSRPGDQGVPSVHAEQSATTATGYISPKPGLACRCADSRRCIGNVTVRGPKCRCPATARRRP